MTPSIELRTEAARLHDAAINSEQAIIHAEDRNADDVERMELDDKCVDAWAAYHRFTNAHGFKLVTDISGPYLRCGRTGIPLVETDIDGDGVEELETGELALREVEVVA